MSTYALDAGILGHLIFEWGPNKFQWDNAPVTMWHMSLSDFAAIDVLVNLIMLHHSWKMSLQQDSVSQTDRATCCIWPPCLIFSVPSQEIVSDMTYFVSNRTYKLSSINQSINQSSPPKWIIVQWPKVKKTFNYKNIALNHTYVRIIVHNTTQRGYEILPS